jgi:NAD+ synthase (glutamine-hydrolysing)
MFYDGSALIVINGKVIAQGSQFSLTDVEVVTATVDLEEVRSFRCAPSRGLQAAQSPTYERINLRTRLSRPEESLDPRKSRSKEIAVEYHTPQEEIA